jgi:hypothetical protein
MSMISNMHFIIAIVVAEAATADNSTNERKKFSRFSLSLSRQSARIVCVCVVSNEERE